MLVYTQGGHIYRAIDYSNYSNELNLINNYKTTTCALLLAVTIVLSIWLSKVAGVNALHALLFFVLTFTSAMLCAFYIVFQLKYFQYFKANAKYCTKSKKHLFKQQKSNFLSYEFFVFTQLFEKEKCCMDTYIQKHSEMLAVHSKITGETLWAKLNLVAKSKKTFL